MYDILKNLNNNDNNDNNDNMGNDNHISKKESIKLNDLTKEL